MCTTAHPLGCAANVKDQILHVQTAAAQSTGPRHVLVIGASSGYGLAARITAAFGHGAATVGVFNEKPARRKKTASAGWYNAAAFDAQARATGLQSLSINGDAFADATRHRTIELIKRQLGGPIDLIIYSLAAPAKTLPNSGETVYTAVKPIGSEFISKTIDTDNDCMADVRIEPATAAEIDATIRVMGGEDWALWLDALAQNKLLAVDAQTIAFSYLGPDVTWPIYAHGTIGRAKQHLETTADQLRQRHAVHSLDARVALMQSIVTQASAAIPSIPLYLSIVMRVMKDKGLHENAIDQQQRLFRDYLYPTGSGRVAPGAKGQLRLDDRELRADVQHACRALRPQVDDSNLYSVTDYAGYQQDFLRLFGFARPDIDYQADVAADAPSQFFTVG